MAQVEVAVHPAEVDPASLPGRRVVMFDVLRASSTIVTALAAGARGVVPALEVEEARAKAKAYGPGVLLGGERGAKRIPGFDLGNSPLEYVDQVVRDRLIIMTTTNGTKALARGAGAREVLVGCLLNAPSLADYLASQPGGDILLICAGVQGRIALEDIMGAGYLVYLLERRGLEVKGDGAFLAAEVYFMYRDDLAAAMGSFEHGRRLLELGFGEDIAYCAQQGLLAVLPRLEGGIIRGDGHVR
ncbi:MAG: 2-phosphosulfolactate phosphatase [Limnochordia bacterium]